MAINSTKQLNEMLIKITKKVTDEIIDKMWSCLRKHILSDTYDLANQPNSYYALGTASPTYEFLNAFQKSEDYANLSNIINKRIFYNWQSMSLQRDEENPEYSVHMSALGEDMREELADILNRNGLIAHKYREAYWDNTINEIENKFNGWVIDAYKRQGITQIL